MLPLRDPAARPEPPVAAEPVEMLAAYLDFHRATLLWKISGIPEETLRRSMTPSGMSLLGIVKHSAYVERFWLQWIVDGREVAFPYSADDPDADWRVNPDETVASVVALYKQECAISREITARTPWDQRVRREWRHASGLTFGWVITHMLEEIARHNGQVDVLREQIDGLTGE